MAKKIDINKVYWTYGLIKYGGKIRIAEIYFERLKTKNRYLFFFCPSVLELIMNIRKVFRDLRNQKKVMKYFEWNGDEIIIK